MAVDPAEVAHASWPTAVVCAAVAQALAPPAKLLAMLDQVADQLNAAVDKVRAPIDEQANLADSVFAEGLETIDGILQLLDTPTPVETGLDGLNDAVDETSAKASELDEQAQSAASEANDCAASLPDDVSQWQSDAETEITSTCDEATASANDASGMHEAFTTAGNDAGSQASNASGELGSLMTSVDTVQDELDSVKQDAQREADATALAGEEPRAILATANSDLDTLLDDALAAIAPPKDKAEEVQKNLY